MTRTRPHAHLRTALFLSTLLDPAALQPLVRRTRRAVEHRAGQVEGVPVEIVRPADERTTAGMVIFLNGAHPLRRREPVVRRALEGLAGTGHVVWAPEPPGLGDGTITEVTLEATVRVVRAAAVDGPVALAGASTGASLALLAAAEPDVAPRVSVVLAAAPFADLRRILCLATTASYDGDEGMTEYLASELLRRVAVRSLAAGVADDRSRAVLLDALDRMEAQAGLDDLGDLATIEGLDDDARSIARLLANGDPARYAELYSALPAQLSSTLRRLSPVHVADRVRAPVEVLAPPSDPYFPLEEARRLTAALRNGTLTVTATLDHTRPTLQRRTLRAFIQFWGAISRALDAADTRSAARDGRQLG